MGVLCKIRGHKWSYCICERCGAVRDESHDWDTCSGRCSVCGKESIPTHDGDPCAKVCSRCGQKLIPQHEWDGCKCNLCGQVRSEHHDYRPLDAHREQCSICNNIRYIPYVGDWESNPLCGILRNRPINYYKYEDSTSHTYFLKRSDECIVAMEEEDNAPEVSQEDFILLLGNDHNAMPQQLHDLFSYWSYAHYPQMKAAYAKAFANVYGLNELLLKACFSLLTQKKCWVAHGQKGKSWGHEATREEISKVIKALPVEIAQNLLFLLSKKQTIEFAIRDYNDDYTKEVELTYGITHLNEVSKIATELLAQSPNFQYDMTHYERFPRHNISKKRKR